MEQVISSSQIFSVKRKNTHRVNVGGVMIGGLAPIVVQSMTNTNTADVTATASQAIELYEAGSEIVRITVNDDAAAKAVPKIYEKLLASSKNIPLVGCFHYNGHKLLSDYPELCQSLAKYRINPGNVGFGHKRDRQFEIMIEKAIEYNKPVRIGVNWGSIDTDLATKLMDENAALANPLSSKEILYITLVQSCLLSAKKAEDIGLGKDRIILSCKVSEPIDLINVYQMLASKCDYAIHLGLTEAGMGVKGIVASTAAVSNLLLSGIGDTIRVSITPSPGEARTKEVSICRQILQSINLRRFTPEVSSCPGCGRTSSDYFIKLASGIEDYIRLQMPSWKMSYPGVENLKIAVMGCIVNGPGESKHANIGISLPGSGENPIAPVFIDGEKKHTLKGDNIDGQFKIILEDYIRSRY